MIIAKRKRSAVEPDPEVSFSPREPKFCMACGSKLVRRLSSVAYSEHTGRLEENYRLRCPRAGWFASLLNVFGGPWHREYEVSGSYWWVRI